MGEVVEIYKTPISLPEAPADDDCINKDLSQREQKWRRFELPSFFDKVTYTKDKVVVLTEEQEKWADADYTRCTKGVWIFINGVKRYLPKKYYFYLQWWVLEDGSRPEYRDSDRRYFTFLEYWEKIQWCLGVIRGKKRREGATSQATSNLVYEVIFFQNSNCGLVSKTQIDSRTAFTGMVAYGYRQLPVFLKPRQLNDESSVSELIFTNKINKSEGNPDAVNDGEQRSIINYRSPVINAYDSGRMSRILLDEFGKLPVDVPASVLFGIVSKTLVKGVRRVGFIEMPSTVNAMNKGGSEFKKLWDSADQAKKKPTTNRLVRYMTAAYDGFEGFIDEFGESVIDAPSEEQYDYLVGKWVKRDPDTDELVSALSEEDIRLGAKEYVLGKLRDGKEGTELEEEVRMNPCDEDEMFMAANTECHFNAMAIVGQRKYLANNPPRTRQVTFFRDMDQVVSWRDDKAGYWHILAFPHESLKNKHSMEGRMRRPGNTDEYGMGVDGYSNSQGGRKYGSIASGFIYRKFDIADPENTGCFVAMYYGRPRDKNMMHDQILLAAEYFGCPVWYEHTADDYKTYFNERGRLGYLGTYPLSAIDPNKRGTVERYKGFPINPFAMTKQLDTMIAYVEAYCGKIYFDLLLDQLLVFQAEDRTKSDAVVAAMIALVSCLDLVHKPPPRKEQLVKTYPRTNNNLDLYRNGKAR